MNIREGYISSHFEVVGWCSCMWHGSISNLFMFAKATAGFFNGKIRTFKQEYCTVLLITESQDSLRTLSWKFQSSLKIYSARVNKTNIAEKDSALHEQKDVSLLPFPDLIWIMF